MKLDKRGNHHIILSTVMLFFTIIGAWSFYHWYKNKEIAQNLNLMLSDFSSAVDRVVTNPVDKAEVDRKIEEIQEIIGKYSISNRTALP